MTTKTNGFAITYGQLKERVFAIQAARGVSQQQIRNFASALNGWMKRLGHDDRTLVGDEMATGFDAHFLRHQDHLIENLSRRTMRDQTEHLLAWRRHVEECRQVDTLPADFKGALNALFTASGISKAELARTSGVTAASIHRWLNLPDLPVAHSAPEIGRLEQALHVPEGTLLNRLPGRRYSRYARTVKESGSIQTAWGKKRTEEKKTLGRYALPLSGLIHQQWLDLIDFKTDGYRDGGAKQNTWRVKPASETGCRISKPMVTASGAICPTAAANWTGISSYLGFLCLKAPGKALAADDVSTLAWLIHFSFVMDYIRWLTARAGGKIHNGIPKFLDDVKCMLRPQTGFLWSRPEIAGTLPNPGMVLGRDYLTLDSEQQAERWRDLCAATHLKIREKVKAIRGREKIGKARDPKEPIANILSSPAPLQVLLKCVQALEASPPPMAQHRGYIVWIRDVLFMKMIVSNPLRVSQFAVMRYRRDNKGNLYQAANGNWRLRFTSANFKNEKGAAHDDYDVAMEPSVGPWISRYLAESRPYAIGVADCDFLFLPFVPGPNRGTRSDGEYETGKGGMWSGEAISRRMRVLTRQYVPDTPGFCAHAVRHIIATDHLKRHPGDYPTVAKLLHDKLETVLKEYAHLTVDQGLQVLHRDIALFNANAASPTV
jgi:transcriptional regulator with XRE-family HTH domain